MYAIFLVTVLALAIINFGDATYGVDVSQRTYSSSFSCMVSYGYSFAIPRVYESGGYPDPNGPGTIADAWAGGMSYVDGYIFPCYSCGDPAGQMDDTISYLAAHDVKVLKKGQLREEAGNSTDGKLGATVGMLWIDVEGTQYWSSSTSSNVNFLTDMVNEGVKKGYNIGIYSSKSQWDPIMGGSTAFSSYPLWYPHYDYDPSFSDFTAFGGWTSPAIKQYQGTTSFCSASVDKNYY
mmetsp:Transcript_18862/g.31557  ORF Transcript_18862/g.31557 Transcript_18862/m.31557 type:complete len:236 (+) Transcript_18862:231-938(+)